MTSPAASSHPSVVVVEDDPDLLSALTFAFEIEGFEVRAYPDAEAVAAVGDVPADACLVLDVRLPGMDGLALLEQIRSRFGERPALMITTPTADIVRRAAAAGVAIVEKPLLSDSLIRQVRSMLAAHGGRPADSD